MIASRSVNMVRRPPTRQLHSNTHCCVWIGHARKQSNSLALSISSRHKVLKSVSRAVLGRVQFTLHATRRTPHGASRLVQTKCAWSVNTRRASSRPSRDARVYGHTTTAMHKTEYTPPPRPPTMLYITRAPHGWVASSGDTHASSRAEQRFDLLDSIESKKRGYAHKHSSLRVQHVRLCQ